MREDGREGGEVEGMAKRRDIGKWHLTWCESARGKSKVKKKAKIKNLGGEKGKKMKNKRSIGIGIATIAIAMLVMLAAFTTPAMASCCVCPVETYGTCPDTSSCSYGTSGSVTNGTVYVDGDGYGELSHKVEHVDFACIPRGTIKWARVYWHIWGGSYDRTGWSNATFCNETGCDYNNRNITSNCQQSEDDGWYKGGCGTHWVYWNVTDKVNSGEVHNITIDDTSWWDGRIMGVYLVVVLDELDDYSGPGMVTHYWVNQGYEDPIGGSSTTWFNGTASNATNGTLWHHSLASHGNFWILFNGKQMKHYPPTPSQYPYMDLEELEVNGIVANDNNMTWNPAPGHPVLAIFMDSRPPGKDLIVENIELPAVMRSNTNYTITATIKNRGSINVTNQSNVSLYVGDSVHDKTIISGLNSSESKTVSFTQQVNLAYGCHTFTVVTDADNNVSEINEGNNNRTEKSQVGYVIVVKSDSDFAKLKQECDDGKLPTGSVTYDSGTDTYYIQNMTIENCAGNGITIENTNAKFLINNCTIHNCTGGSGLYLRNLTSGAINGSEIQNNSHYGIKVGETPLSSEDPQFVNITNNTIEKNNIEGIDLVGFNCTMRNNTIQNNTLYGIFVLGNDNNITYNNITNNGDYGVKMYNSSRNYVYENNFTDNNAAYPNRTSQGWDNRNNHWNNTGNYWSDYSGYDGDNNGIGEIPYDIDGGTAKDYYPVCTPELCSVDLVISKAWVNCTKIGNKNADCDCTIKYTIKNIANGTVPAGHNTTLFVNDNEMALDYADITLASGESRIRSFSYTWTYTPPSDDIAICADYNNTVNEFAGEGNNWLNVTWKCGDATADENVWLNDGWQIYSNKTFPGQYPIHLWAADVTNDGNVWLNDGWQIYSNKTFPGLYPLNCQCCS